MKLFYFFFFFFFLSLVLTPLISAQPATQFNINTDTGIDVEFSKVNILKQNEAHLFNAHVFNRSDGLRLTNVTTNCNFHLFDNMGTALIDQKSMFFDIVGLDWEQNVLKGNFTNNGDLSYLIVCNSSSIGGFASVGVMVTADGNPFQAFPNQFAFIGLAFLLIIFGLINDRLNLLQSIGSIILMVMGVLTIYPGYNFINHTNLFGLTLGTSLIAIGFYFLIEGSFSREKQRDRFHQPQGDKEEDFQ